MKGRRPFLQSILYSFLLTFFGPNLADKLCGYCPTKYALLRRKMKFKGVEGMIFAPWMPLYVTSPIEPLPLAISAGNSKLMYGTKNKGTHQ